MTKRLLSISALVVLTSLSACALSEKNTSLVPSISEESRANLDKGVNCATAQQDIKVLEEEHASVGRRMVAGVRSVLPIAIVAGILTNDYNDRVEVATGQYNEDIEKKIAEIKKTCGI